jgi:hypothetical protein
MRCATRKTSNRLAGALRLAAFGFQPADGKRQ